MEITNVEAVPVNVPLVDFEDGGIAPYVTNHGSLDDMDRVLVRVDTDEGISGWGEVRVFLSPATTVTAIEDGIADLVVGHSPFETDSFRHLLFTEYANVTALLAPVEIACWDIVGKALEMPVYELLGGWTAPDTNSRRHREHVAEYGEEDGVPVAYCLGILPPAQSAERAAEVADEGYRVLKTKAGRDWRQDVERILAMDEAADGRLEFRLDPNQGWTIDQAVRVGQMLADAGVYLQYMEQPIRVDSHRALSRLSHRLPQPVAPNEDTYIAHNLRDLIEAGAVDVAVLDMTPMGGIAGLRDAAAIARDAAIPFTHHCAFDLGVRTAAILHAVHGIPGFELPSDTAYYGWEGDVITDPLTVDGGRMTVPDGPGLGVEVDEDAVARYRIEGV